MAVSAAKVSQILALPDKKCLRSFERTLRSVHQSCPDRVLCPEITIFDWLVSSRATPTTSSSVYCSPVSAIGYLFASSKYWPSSLSGRRARRIGCTRQAPFLPRASRAHDCELAQRLVASGQASSLPVGMVSLARYKRSPVYPTTRHCSRKSTHHSSTGYTASCSK